MQNAVNFFDSHTAFSFDEDFDRSHLPQNCSQLFDAGRKLLKQHVTSDILCDLLSYEDQSDFLDIFGSIKFYE